MTHDELVNAIRYCYNRYHGVILALAEQTQDPRKWNAAFFEAIKIQPDEETLPPDNPCETCTIFYSSEGLIGMCARVPNRTCEWALEVK